MSAGGTARGVSADQTGTEKGKPGGTGFRAPRAEPNKNIVPLTYKRIYAGDIVSD
jgi:hypothetical protein